MTTEPTILDALLASLEAAAAYNRSDQVPPAAVLWPDPDEQWAPLLPALRAALPQLLVLGDYQPQERRGPAIWLKCMVARTLPEADWPEEAVPILYLPAIRRAELRAVESCPPPLQPLVELQYRGTFWAQPNGRDWTVPAFLRGKKGGLGLDVARDKRTLAAMSRALPKLAETPVSSLRGRRLEAADFDRLLVPDPVRDLLRWLDQPASAREQWGPRVWGAFRSICVEDYGFDPETDGELVGAEKLALKEGKWKGVWDRFAEAPHLYPGLPALLGKAERSARQDLFDRSTWPGANEKAEEELRSSLLDLEGLPRLEACERIWKLEHEHGERRDWVWAQLGRAPLARALLHLASLADAVSQSLGGGSPEQMARAYAAGAWRADEAVWRALASVERKDDYAAVTVALRALYLPWAAAAAKHLQELVARQGFPGQPAPSEGAKAIEPSPGECLFFVDGLRFDVGQALREELEARGMEVGIRTRWQGLPSVTGTCKPAVSPIAHRLTGRSDSSEQFLPSLAETGEPLSTHRFRKLIEGSGIQLLAEGENGDPSGRAWCEHGDLDHLGHQEGARLARRIGEQVREIADRIAELLEAGWRRVLVVTDHGWLLLPGGLPRAELPRYLAETRWGRCALLVDTARATELVVPWRWSADVRVALPPGIRSFKANSEYAHGGLSLQECLVPELLVTRPVDAGGGVAIARVRWLGLRCRVLLSGAAPGLRVDLRTRSAQAESSLVGGGKPVKADGRVSLVVEDEDAEGMAAVLVVLDERGSVLSKRTTTVGGED